MREIKFRAWNVKNQVMCSVYHIEWLKEGIWVSCLPHLKDTRRVLGVPKNPLLQFTGLLDKNGKEIYEGDVVVEPHSHNGTEEVGSCEVRYVGSGFCKMWKGKHYGLPNYTDQAANRLEVIGNIYENPELVKS